MVLVIRPWPLDHSAGCGYCSLLLQSCFLVCVLALQTRPLSLCWWFCFWIWKLSLWVLVIVCGFWLIDLGSWSWFLVLESWLFGLRFESRFLGIWFHSWSLKLDSWLLILDSWLSALIHLSSFFGSWFWLSKLLLTNLSILVPGPSFLVLVLDSSFLCLRSGSPTSNHCFMLYYS